ncbi:hypothetical protein [Fibrobacter sp. HC4]|uniref:hypothetical protein n=1 Tax=Fibrobacter sp. HC4 TaxID=3239812 RepID=UPI0020188192|nr:hypothetical protein [Fibrobacter succinogenes]MCL4103373.1 hypothetical protein [Fibrobacter succinogenes]
MFKCKKKIATAFVVIVNIVSACALYEVAYGEYADQSVLSEILSFEKISFVNCVILVDVFLLIAIIVWKFLRKKYPNSP